MKINIDITAMGYRIPRMLLKDAMMTVLTLGIKKPKHVKEEAKTLLYSINHLTMTINEETSLGILKELDHKVMESVEEKEQILDKGKFTHGHYIYYLDKETVKENSYK